MFFSRAKGNKSKTFCSVYGCSSKALRCPQLAFHGFPPAGIRKVKIENELGLEEIVDIRKAWEIVLKMGKSSSKYMRICSLHFQESDYFPLCRRLCCFFLNNVNDNALIILDNAQRKHLRRNAVPSLNLPKYSYPSATGNIQSVSLSSGTRESTVVHEVCAQKNNFYI